MLVAGIETVWGGFEAPGAGLVRETDFTEQNLVYAKGEEIGQFKFGSTAIILFEKNIAQGLDNLQPQASVIMGEKIAVLG